MTATTKTVQLDLTEAGFPGQSVELRDPKYLSNKHFEELVAELRRDDRTNEENQAFFRARIASWSIAGEDGQPIADPATADLDDIPVGITTAIGAKISQLFEVAIPNASRRQ